VRGKKKVLYIFYDHFLASKFLFFKLHSHRAFTLLGIVLPQNEFEASNMNDLLLTTIPSEW